MPPRREATYLALLVAAYLATRLHDLTSFPLFIDEAVHIAWSRATLQGQLLAGSWGGRWLSIKIMAAFVALPLDPVFAARLSATLAGAGALLACVLVGRRLYSARIGLAAGVLYTALPYALLYNRMALADTFAAAFAGAVLYLSIAAAQRRRDVVALSIALACMFLAKISTVVLLPVPLAAVLLFQPRSAWRRGLTRLAPAFVPVFIAGGLMAWRGHGVQYVPQQAAAGSLEYQATLIQVNIASLSEWFWILLTPPIAIAAALIPFWLLRRQRAPADLLLAATFVLAVAPFVLVSPTWFPRYLAPALVPLSVLLARAGAAAADAFAGARGVRGGLAAASIALLAWPLWLDAEIILRPETAPLPGIERAEFIEGWGAGTGVPELADYLRRRSAAAARGINVVRFYFWNQANQGLDVYLSPSPTLAMHTIDPTRADATAQIARLAAAAPTVLVLNPPNDTSHLAEIGRSVGDYVAAAERVWHYPRAGDRSALEVWEIASVARDQ